MKVTIKTSDILYDVDYTTWKVAKCRIAEPQAQSEAQTDNDNMRWFRRQYETALNYIKGRLRVYVVPNDDPNTIEFKFNNWKGDINALSTYIHRFIVDYILFEWFKMTIPTEAQTYLTSANAWEEKMMNEARSEDVSNVFFRL